MEGIYLIHIREFIKSKENVLKLGRSDNLDNRVRQYPKGSNILFMMKCKDSILCEQYLLNLFNIKFTHKSEYGKEFFEGNEDEMIDEIYKYLNQYRINYARKDSVKGLGTNHIPKIKTIKTNIKENLNSSDRICPNCKYEFKYPSLLKAHFRKAYHCLLSEEAITLFFNDKISIPNKQINKCQKCKTQFKNRQAYIRHHKETKCGKSQNLINL